MSWYYAENNERLGPLEDAAFAALVKAGTITPETLVWREGLENWVTLASINYVAPPVVNMPPPLDPDSANAAPRTGVEMGMCSESGRILPRSELIEIDGRLVSAEYKNVVLQRIREGLSSSSAAEDPEAIAQRILSEGWDIQVGSCVSRGWAVVRQNFWLCTGSTFLVYLVIAAAGMVPFGGIVVQGPLIGGLYWMILKLLRKEPAAVGDAFQGFNRGWGQLVAASIMGTIMMIPCFLPGIVVFIMAGINEKNGQSSEGTFIVAGVLFLIGFLLACYFVIGWMFAVPLVVDKRIEWWPAMKLSRRVVNLHWWKIFGLLFLVGIIVGGVMVAGMILIGVVIAMMSGNKDSMGPLVGLVIVIGFGLAAAFFTLLPLGFSTLMVAYEDIFAKKTEP